MRPRILGLLLSAGIATSACTVNPVTGEKEFSLVSGQQEVSIGEQNYEAYQQQQGGAYSVDPELTLYVKEIGQKLAKLSDRPGLPYDFVVLNDSTPNAWALPGGKIAINRGLMVLLDDEAQLAAVLGHEIVHAAARHAAQQMTQQQVLGIGVAVAGLAASQQENGELIGLGLMGGAALYQAHYGRSQELESDRYGMDYMSRAGYEPQAAVELQQTFVKLSEGRQADLFSNLFASHPPSQARVERNREMAKKLPSGERNRERYQRAIAQLLKDKKAYELHQQAMQAAGKKDFAKAKQLLKQAISAQDQEALFYNSLGQIELGEKDYNSAETQFRKAYARNPGYFMSSLGLGLALKAQKKNTEAIQMLSTSRKILPTQLASYHLGELSLAEGRRSDAVAYFDETAKGGGELGDAAKQKLASLQPGA